MIALDTNVLVRVFVDDKTIQTQLARNLVKDKKVFLPTVVQAEFFWVLRQSIKLEKANIIKALTMLKNNPDYLLEQEENFAQALALYETSNADFADNLIVSECQNRNVTLWTFDKKLSKHDNANLLA